MSPRYADRVSHPNDPAQRRSAIAYGVIVAVLAIAAIGAWVAVSRTDSGRTMVACELPAAGEVVPSTKLVGVAAVAPSSIPVRVLNAGGTAGAAGSVSGTLTELGFTPAPVDPVGNDPLVPDQDLDCHGQIRFGADHLASAATLHLVFPCFELVRDQRPGDIVDVSLGSGSDGPDDSEAVRNVLTALNEGREIPDSATGSFGHATC